VVDVVVEGAEVVDVVVVELSEDAGRAPCLVAGVAAWARAAVGATKDRMIATTALNAVKERRRRPPPGRRPSS
jgi:hypothetical protein